MRIFKIFGNVLKINVLNELQYNKDLIVQVFSVIIDIFLSLAILQIMFSGINTIGNWKKEEILILVGIYRTIDGLLKLFIIPSLSSLSYTIIYGKLDYMLLLPVDSQFILCIKDIKIFKVSDILIGLLFVIIVALVFNIQIILLNMLGTIVTVIIGCVIIASFYSIIASLSFWFINSSNFLILFPQCLEWTGKWPITIFPKFFKFLFSFIIPVGLAVTVPAEVLLNKYDGKLILISIILAICMALFARFLWKMGLKKYSGASA